MDDDAGIAAVRFARSEVMSEACGEAPRPFPEGPAFSEMRGAFVTLDAYPDMTLRGCIGYPYPVMPLEEAISRSARGACHDPRFLALSAEEASNVVVEVTVLTTPRLMDAESPDGIMGAVRIGRDGLMLEYNGYRGLLLPQVPEEMGWGVKEYLQGLSRKAGLPPDAWSRPRARLYSFEGEVFHEKAPFGEVERRA